MQHVVMSAIAAAAVPVSLFAWMMGTAALALISNGENPREVLAMPRTFFRGRSFLAIHQDHTPEMQGEAIGD